MGKSAAVFFATVVAHLGADAARTVKAGDDIAADVLAVQCRGSPGRWSSPASTFPVRIATPSGPPDHLLDSFGDLSALLGQLS